VILNPTNICACGAPKASGSRTCMPCRDTKGGISAGRPATYTDEQILTALESGDTTLDALLSTLGLKSKSTLVTRLRRMRDDGLVTIIERPRREGFTILSNRVDQ